MYLNLCNWIGINNGVLGDVYGLWVDMLVYKFDFIEFNNEELLKKIF